MFAFFIEFAKYLSHTFFHLYVSLITLSPIPIEVIHDTCFNHDNIVKLTPGCRNSMKKNEAFLMAYGLLLQMAIENNRDKTDDSLKWIMKKYHKLTSCSEGLHPISKIIVSTYDMVRDRKLKATGEISNARLINELLTSHSTELIENYTDDCITLVNSNHRRNKLLQKARKTAVEIYTATI